MEENDIIEKWKDFFDKEIKMLKDNVLNIQFNKILEFDLDLADSLLDFPDKSFECIRIALDDNNKRVRIIDLPKTSEVRIGDIRSNYLNRLISIEGLIKSASEVRPQATTTRFECGSCGNIINIIQTEQIAKEPYHCSCGRKSGFKKLSEELIDIQRISLEEPPDVLEGTEQPKKINVILKEDLTDPRIEKHTTPGSRVIIVGILKSMPITTRTGKKLIKYDLVIDANSITLLDQDTEINITEADLEKIKEISKNPFDLLIKSIAPDIYGNESIKESLLLQLFGGVKRKKKGKNRFTRESIHIFLVGDPSTSKSQLALYVSEIAPRARFASGTGSTGKGITCVVSHDDFTGGMTLEAGPFVFANRGLFVLDETDKLETDDIEKLHEGMESPQVININKGNIHATLKTETSLLSVANPEHGRFDTDQTLTSQLNKKISPSFLARFDMLWIIVDYKNPERDKKIAEIILDTYEGEEIDIEPPVNQELFKKYIAYAKQHFKPILTKEASDEIKNFYLKMRSNVQDKRIQITARQIEGLIRLATASAKIRLSNKVEREDSQRVINLYLKMLKVVAIDLETGLIDIDEIITGMPTSKREKVNYIKSIIEGEMPVEEIIEKCRSKNIDRFEIEEIVGILQKNGEIFEPVRGKLKRV